ncbi:of the drug metabolite transporter (DMT) superfamily [Vibrio sp. B1FLJ16]|uniref:DMT family transporter n=1 Tax=Vibrio sp. B1FLJ16 TaxID=2751178 RepID=UPI0015F4FE87|nr:EamA family transporter [Vibrio sp. B1FLJ16]CAD7804948.1 of the drug metabolite transporter (DMT) superfamily [Vibrio sp. B1FLJ16]CAE6898538.1 of the drug metabolite transporter (DMT) superfamily [Vibrio sp. B1FLJ16]
MNILLAMIPAFFWGTTYAVTQFTVPDWPPILLGAIRALPAGLLLLALKPTLPQKHEWKPLFVLGTINIAMFFCLVFVMALTLPAAIAGVGMISIPVFAMLYHWAVYKRKPGTMQVFRGVALIALAWLLFNPQTITLNPVGLLAMFAAIMCIVIGSSVTKLMGARMHWWTVLTWQLIIGGVILTVVSGVMATLNPEPYLSTLKNISLNNTLGLLWVILFNTALSYTMYVWLLQRMSVVDFTFGNIINPIAGILSGLLLLGESFTLLQYGLMLSMILVSLLPQLMMKFFNK